MDTKELVKLAKELEKLQRQLAIIDAKREPLLVAIREKKRGIANMSGIYYPPEKPAETLISRILAYAKTTDNFSCKTLCTALEIDGQKALSVGPMLSSLVKKGKLILISRGIYANN